MEDAADTAFARGGDIFGIIIYEHRSFRINSELIKQRSVNGCIGFPLMDSEGP
jgi:hypothetical protein